MELGLGHLGLSPDSFWSLTLPEFRAKLNGFMEFHGVKSKSVPTRDELEATLDDFPDGPLPRDLWIKHKRSWAEKRLH